MSNEKIVVEEISEEQKGGNLKYYLKICITLLLISALTAGLLAFVNSVTKDKIAANELAVMEEAMGRIFVACDKIESIEGEYEEPVVAVYAVYREGEMLGYGIQSTPMGFKDGIGLIVGTDLKGNCLGVEITSISDTPGVGTKVNEGNFLFGFKGLNGETVNDYDTISGATISSKAVKNGVSAALSLDIFIEDGVSEGEAEENSELSEANEETEENGEELSEESVAEETATEVEAE